LRDVDEVHEYSPPEFIAFAWSWGNPLLEPMIVLPLDDGDPEHRIATHELTHVISYDALPDQPRWFAEGLASFFETVKLDEHYNVVQLGAPMPGRASTLLHHGPLPVAQLV